MRCVVGLAASVALVIGVLPTQAARSRGAAIRIAYQHPVDEETRALHRDLKARRVLEGLQAIVRGMHPPRSLTLQLSTCGESNAWYAPKSRTITVCYEYVHEVRDRASTIISETGLTQRDAIFGPVAQIFLHELGHALYDLLDVPVLGREEDAADQFAALILLELPSAQARHAIDSTAHLLRSQAAEERPADQAVLADDHSLAGQRLYNLLCLAYGADRKTFGYLVEGGTLPKARAAHCRAEYDLAAYALQKLFRPHLRDGRIGRARIRRAFRWMF